MLESGRLEVAYYLSKTDKQKISKRTKISGFLPPLCLISLQSLKEGNYARYHIIFQFELVLLGIKGKGVLRAF